MGLDDKACLKVTKQSGNCYSIISVHSIILDLVLVTSTSDKECTCITMNNPLLKTLIHNYGIWQTQALLLLSVCPHLLTAIKSPLGSSSLIHSEKAHVKLYSSYLYTPDGTLQLHGLLCEINHTISTSTTVTELLH